MNIIPLDQLSGYIWLNGKFIDWSDAKVHTLTHSLHYGSSVFEGERAYNGKIFKLKEHTDRLFKSAATYNIKIQYTPEDIMSACRESLTKNNIQEAYVRPLIWHGPENVWISTKTHSVHVMIASWCPASYLKPMPKKRLNICLSKWIKPSADMIPVDCKSAANYPMLTLSKNQALDEGFDDAMMLDSKGFITECTGSNIFFYKNDTLLTPIPDCFLNGITRQTVLEIAKASGINCIEKYITIDDIKGADECFITGTASEIQSVISLTCSDNKKIIFEKTSIADNILNQYQKLVRE